MLPTTGLAAARDPVTVRVAIQKVLDALWTQVVPAVMWGGMGFAGLKVRLNYEGTLVDGLGAAIDKVLSTLNPPAHQSEAA